MTDSTVRGDFPHLATHIDKDVEEEVTEGTDRQTSAIGDKEREEKREEARRQFPPASEEEVYEGAERAKADFVQAATGDTPEPTGDEQVPPAQRRAQERVARERH